MTGLFRQYPRWGVVIALVLGLAPFWLSPAAAQRSVVERDYDVPDFMEQQQWLCNQCQSAVGSGPIPPAISKCPYCGVRLSAFHFGDATPAATSPSTPFAWPEIELSPPVLAGIGVTSLILVVCGLFHFFGRDNDPVPIDDPSAP